MARIEAKKKMGYYPTQYLAIIEIKKFLSFPDENEIINTIDPCCGDGLALYYLTPSNTETFGIEIDTERAREANEKINHVIVGDTLSSVIVRPTESFSLLFLNPPYDFQDGERLEYLFLKKSHNWLMPEGVLIYIIPDYILAHKKIQNFLSRHYKDIRVVKINENYYPQFKQIVLFAIKRAKENEDLGLVPQPPYEYIDNTPAVEFTYKIPESANAIEIFETKKLMPSDIKKFKDNAIKSIREITNSFTTTQQKSPIFPLRKGHLVSLLMSGVLNGTLQTDTNNEITFKCFTERKKTTVEIDNKEITTDTYTSGIRIIERGKWYDIK